MERIAECLKIIYPDIKDTDFVIEINADGSENIVEWNYSQPIPTQDQLIQALYKVYQQLKTDEIRRDYNAKMQQLVQDVYENEIRTYPVQEYEARLYEKDPNAKTPFIDALCKARGIDKQTLVQRILYRAQIYSEKAGELLGLQQHHLDIIWSGKLTLDELKNYIWE